MKISSPYSHCKAKKEKVEVVSIKRKLISKIKTFFSTMNNKQKTFMVFGVAPFVLAYLVYAVQFKINYQDHGVFKSWDVWRAYQHEWCYLVAVLSWFALIFWYLKDGTSNHGTN